MIGAGWVAAVLVGWSLVGCSTRNNAVWVGTLEAATNAHGQRRLELERVAVAVSVANLVDRPPTGRGLAGGGRMGFRGLVVGR